MKKLLVSILAVVAISAFALPAFSAEIPVNGDAGDKGITATGGFWNGQADVRVGAGSTESSGMALVFELPTLVEGDSVASAELEFSIIGGSNWKSLFEHGIDLYAVRMSDTVDPGTADFYQGVYGGDPDATAIQQRIVYESEYLNQAAPGQMGRFDTSDEAEVALGSWIQDQYESEEYDESGSNYVILTLMPDENFSATYRYWSVATANNSSTEDRPLLTLKTIPEPATAGLLAIGAVSMFRRKR